MRHSFPDIHAAHPNAHLENVNRSQLADWINASNHGALIQIMFQTSWNPERVPILVDLVRNVLTENFGAKDFLVSPARPEREPTREDGPPYTFAILNLTEKVADEIIERKCISNHKIAFNPQNAYRGGEGGLETQRSIRDPGRHRAVQAGNPDDVVMGSEEHEENESIADINDVETIFDTLTLYRVEIKAKGGHDATSLNIYIELQDPTPQQWNSLTNAVSKVKYTFNMNGYGKYSKGWTTRPAFALSSWKSPHGTNSAASAYKRLTPGTRRHSQRVPRAPRTERRREVEDTQVDTKRGEAEAEDMASRTTDTEDREEEEAEAAGACRGDTIAWPEVPPQEDEPEPDSNPQYEILLRCPEITILTIPTHDE
ncbi:hypothetical protein HWV62_3564 [Athelia sp. TMB]|nr:hypothetical protein HWV62_3564 [Athelia sp. TMB]